MRIARTRTHLRAWTVIAALAGLLAAGCAGIDTGPFTQFAASLQKLRDGSDPRVEAVAKASRTDLVQKVAAGDVKVVDLLLEFDEFDNFSATYGAETEPLYPKLMRLRRGLQALNLSMVDYAQSLATLSGGAEGGDILPSSADFDKMAGTLNANAGAAASALNVKVSSGDRALLSTGAVQLFKAYLESKRRKDLQRAILEVQPRVDEFATAAKNAMRFLAEMVKTEYSEQTLLLADDPLNAEPMLTLNETTQSTLGALSALSRSYGALSAAHRELSAATSKRPGALAGITALTDEATRLQGFVTQLAKANADEEAKAKAAEEAEAKAAKDTEAEKDH